MEQIPWEELFDLAAEAMGCAYAPYSGYPVGAAALVDDGRLISGCNVENASTGVGLCAECGMIGELIRGGGGKLLAFVAVNGNREIVVPCGRCRQLLFEHGGGGLRVKIPTGEVLSMNRMMPYGFGPKELAQVPGSVGSKR